jgi:alkanesulfonate monooxygenase SsuD/methylene tetrahydromethanopterin reductase-like flavin-dependent oxidoreductase (luciferase family)/GNAT superfamily N-acetyltransferase
MSGSEIRIVAESWNGAAASRLRDQMDVEIHPRYADLHDDLPKLPSVIDLDDIIFTLIAYDGDRAAGTISLKRTGDYAEVKRVFVAEAYRRTGLAARLLAALEEAARGRGIRDLVLQTGLRQPEAIALYLREGWTAIPPFGPYAADTVISRCFAKPIVPLVLGIELAARGGAGESRGVARRAVTAIETLDAARVDLIVVADRYLEEEAGSVSIDAPTVATFAAPRTSHAALVPVLTATHTEPFHVAKTIQTLDFVSRGRAGWQPGVESAADVAALFGRKRTADRATLWAEADEAIEVARRLWDSWEDDAEIRDVATGRFIDRDRVHHIDFEGRFFSVKGPSIVPRSPQGLPPIVVRVQEGDEDALRVAVDRADLIRVPASAVAWARKAVTDAGGSTAVVVDLPTSGAPDRDAARAVSVRHDSGADGAILVFDGIPDDPAALANAVRAVGSGRTGSFRERLELSRPVSRYAREEISV